MDTRYPPAPWSLRGDMFVAVLRMPPNTVPEDLVPAGARDRHRPDRGMLLACSFVDYQPGGVLRYREFLVAATNTTMTGLSTILKIWVDSPESKAGGRDLWFIPKDLADFDLRVADGLNGTVLVEGAPAASYEFRPKWTVPGRWSVPNRLLQERDGVLRRTTSRFRDARFQFGRGTLDIAEHGPVGFLRQGRVVRQVAMRDFRASFGDRSALV